MLPSGQMHLSGALPVPPNVRKKHPEPGPVVSCSFARWLCSLPAGVLRMLGHALFLFLFGMKGVSQIFDRVYKFGIFIALIHPIQWTIALPVGATGPAKRQKKTSCI